MAVFRCKFPDKSCLKIFKRIQIKEKTFVLFYRMEGWDLNSVMKDMRANPSNSLTLTILSGSDVCELFKTWSVMRAKGKRDQSHIFYQKCCSFKLFFYVNVKKIQYMISNYVKFIVIGIVIETSCYSVCANLLTPCAVLLALDLCYNQNNKKTSNIGPGWPE